MAKVIDTCGLSCPQPVLMVHEAARSGDKALDVLVDNEAGVLSQVSRLFSRKGYNIESLAVGTTDDPDVSRITIEVLCDGPMIDQIMNQLRKQFSV